MNNVFAQGSRLNVHHFRNWIEIWCTMVHEEVWSMFTLAVKSKYCNFETFWVWKDTQTIMLSVQVLLPSFFTGSRLGVWLFLSGLLLLLFLIPSKLVVLLLVPSFGTAGIFPLKQSTQLEHCYYTHPQDNDDHQHPQYFPWTLSYVRWELSWSCC